MSLDSDLIFQLFRRYLFPHVGGFCVVVLQAILPSLKHLRERHSFNVIMFSVFHMIMLAYIYGNGSSSK